MAYIKLLNLIAEGTYIADITNVTCNMNIQLETGSYHQFIIEFSNTIREVFYVSTTDCKKEDPLVSLFYKLGLDFVNGFDTEALIGVDCMITVKHEILSNGITVINITDVYPWQEFADDTEDIDECIESLYNYHVMEAEKDESDDVCKNACSENPEPNQG